MKKIIISIFATLFMMNINADERPCSQYKKIFPENLKYNECMSKLKAEGKLKKKDSKGIEIVKEKSKPIIEKAGSVIKGFNNETTLTDWIKKQRK